MDLFVNRTALSQPQETSSLASPRESHSLLRMWRIFRDYQKQINRLTNNVSQLQQQIANTPIASSGMHPFKIYQFPSQMRLFHPADEWRRVKVRGGLTFIKNGVSANVAGSDGAFGTGGTVDYGTKEAFLNPYTTQTLPVDGTNYDYPTWNEFTVPDSGGVIYLGFYQTQVSGAWEVRFTNDGVTATAFVDGTTFSDPWPQFFAQDPLHIPIGRVDIVKGVLVIQQWLTGSPWVPQYLPAFANATTVAGIPAPAGCMMRYAGDYDAAANYYVGDVVTEISTVTGNNWLNEFIFWPPAGSIYLPETNGALVGIDPLTHTPDPWKLLQKSPVGAEYHLDASYQAAKYYLRTT